MTVEKLIEKVTEDIKELLLEKNRAYGNSALSPKNVFSQGDVFESLGSRIDDKLMRIQNVGVNDETEDTLSDLIGYLILYKVALIKEKNDSYEGDKEIIEMGGFVVEDGKSINTMEELEVKYFEKKSKK
jgi:hypothetical protein|tara:strand:- start:4513 stop:4899 length:387 start_codon:yes stop_codon:yes gene_type:complete